MVEKGQIIRRTGTVGGLTLVSRIFGLIRDMVVAYAFGASNIADAFFVAFRIPNLLRRFFAEGALTISFVPVFSGYLKKDREEARVVVDVSFTVLTLVLIGVVIIGIIAAPWIVDLMAYGFKDDPGKYALTVLLTRIMFPFILLVSLAGLCMGILNSVKHFAIPAAAPIMLNIGIILGALGLAKFIDPPVVGLAFGVLIGGILQFAIHLPALWKYRLFPRPNFNVSHPAVKQILPLMGASAYGAAVYQVNTIVITLLASFLAEGSVSWLWYAGRIMEFPLGIFGISLATVLLPTMSDHAADGNHEMMHQTLNYGLRMSFFLSLPAMAGLIVLAEPITRIIFQHGTFTPLATVATSQALIYFAFGLPFVAAVRVTTNAFFSVQDSKTPVMMANLAVVVNIGAAVLLMRPMAHNGLALALSISALANFTFQLVAYRRKVGRLGLKMMLRSAVRIGIAASLMALMVYSLRYFGGFFAANDPLIHQIPQLVLCIGVGLVAYPIILFLIRSEELHEMWGMAKGRIARRGRS